MAENPRTGADEIAAAVQTLATADTVAFGGVGFANQILPPTAAFQTLDEALPEQLDAVRHELVRLLTEATPAGRAYAATLLNRIDPAAGREAWRSMAGDRGELSTFSGCVMRRTTLGEYASGQLDRR